MRLEGYLHSAYAYSLAEFGTPRHLERSGGWLLERKTPFAEGSDAMGCYPLFSCEDWSRLHLDLDELSGLVSVAVVADPFGNHQLDDLKRCFPDRVVHFKDHHVVDLEKFTWASVSKHHRYYSRRALGQVQVECCDPAEMMGEWIDLYRELIHRHGLTGIKAFSPAAFEAQLHVPGIVAFRAQHDGTTVGAHLWYLQGNVAYSHLTAMSPIGYELMSSYALHSTAIEHFQGKAQWMNLGAGAGASRDGNDGLAHFKRGWANGVRPAYFCGRVCDRDLYDALLVASGKASDSYFPAYRAGELT